jgi:Uma2 family endonuclease
MAEIAEKYVDESQYLKMEAQADVRHEYMNGVVYDMAGASTAHNRIVRNLIGELHAYLKGKACEVFPSGCRISAPNLNAYMYPDISIVCEEVEKKPDVFDTIINPSVIIETLSPTTRGIDKGTKLFNYLQIPSLKEYILVDADTYNVKTIIKRNDDTFKIRCTSGLQSILLINIVGIEIPMSDVYYMVDVS